ncbi:MAG: transcription antitermination factor NusB [Kiritimatiellae bacterium]|nr:transcription antitermination factor NusB [Kiritimatiellia bacterium]
MSSRREAIFVITNWLQTKSFPDRLISNSSDRAFVTDLVYTTVRRYRTLDWAVRKFVKKMPQGETGAALLTGACQILFMPDVADYAAVNESVEAAKIASQKTAGLVNGVLRNLLRQRDAVLADLAVQPIGIRLSHPDALVTRWLERFGAAETAALCEWNNTPAETFLAYPSPAATLSPSPAQPLESLFTPLPRGTRVEDAPGYAEGTFIVQDPATAASLELLDARLGLRVLDACAAPGGKTVQIAWRMGPPTSENHALVALDLHDDRLATLRTNLERTRQTWVTTAKADLTDDPQSLWERFGLFDRILLDAPCSNTGVLRRRPDARWRWTTKRMKQLAATQFQMLENLLPLLAPGGRLVYSTCSLEQEENRRQITLLRKDHPEIACVAVEERIPTRSKTDGAFVCALECQP